MEIYILDGKEYDLSSFSKDQKKEWLELNPNAKIKSKDFQTPTPIGVDAEEVIVSDTISKESSLDSSPTKTDTFVNPMSGEAIEIKEGDTNEFNPKNLNFEDFEKLVRKKYPLINQAPRGVLLERKRLKDIQEAEEIEPEIVSAVTNIPPAEINKKVGDEYFDLDNIPAGRRGGRDEDFRVYPSMSAEEYLKPKGKWEQYQNYLETGKIDPTLYNGESVEDNKIELETLYTNKRNELMNKKQQLLLSGLSEDVRKNISFYGEGEEFKNEEDAITDLDKLSNAIKISNESVLKANEKYNIDVKKLNSSISAIDSQLKEIVKNANGDI